MHDPELPACQVSTQLPEPCLSHSSSITCFMFTILPFWNRTPGRLYSLCIQTWLPIWNLTKADCKRPRSLRETAECCFCFLNKFLVLSNQAACIRTSIVALPDSHLPVETALWKAELSWPVPAPPPASQRCCLWETDVTQPLLCSLGVCKLSPFFLSNLLGSENNGFQCPCPH